MKFTSFVYTFVCIIGYPFVASITSRSWANQLRFDLLKSYDPFAEPNPKNETTLRIQLGINVLGINVDYMQSTFHVNGWIALNWYDSRLKWDPSKYDDMKSISLAFHELWKPEIIAMNRVDAHNVEHYAQKNTVVMNTGYVIFVPLTNFKVYCNLNYLDWPFDEQVCELILRISGTYRTPLQFNDTYRMDGFSMSNWDVVSMIPQHIATNSCRLCQGPISEMHYEFRLRKIEKVYYGFVLLPAFGACLLLLATFWLPLTDIKKFPLIIILMITSLVFLIFFSRQVPVFNHQLPKIMQFHIWLMTLSTLYLVISFILHNTVDSTDLQTKPISQRIMMLFDHPVLRVIYLVPDSEFVRYQLEKLSSTQALVDATYSKHQWLRLTITINRIIFVFYALIFLILMLYNFI